MAATNSSSWFTRFAKATARAAGRPGASMIALGAIVVWAITGPIFGFSDTWQSVISIGATVVTFLMLFLIQSTQHRDAEAVQVKLDELIRAVEGAHVTLVKIEETDEAEFERIRGNYARLAERARSDLERGDVDTGVPDID